MELAEYKNLHQDEFLQRVFDAIPAFVFIVDEDVRFHFWNAPARQLVGENPAQVYLKRAGEVLRCIHIVNAAEERCGISPFCRECVIRNAVSDAFTAGKTYRESTRMDIWIGSSISEVYILLTVSPIHYKEGEFALLLMEEERHLLVEDFERENPDPARGEPVVTLSPSEQKIMKWVQKGKSSWSISRILDMNVRTVNYHIYNIIEKLDAMNRTQAVAIALKMGLIREDDQ